MDLPAITQRSLYLEREKERERTGPTTVYICACVCVEREKEAEGVVTDGHGGMDFGPFSLEKDSLLRVKGGGGGTTQNLALHRRHLLSFVVCVSDK